jgi:hypothetical protein
MKQHTHHRTVISGKSVIVGANPVYVGGENPLPAPKIALVRNGQDISAIEIQCGCGQVIVVDCVYDQSQGTVSKGLDDDLQ